MIFPSDTDIEFYYTNWMMGMEEDDDLGWWIDMDEQKICWSCGEELDVKNAFARTASGNIHMTSDCLYTVLQHQEEQRSTQNWL